MELFPIPDGHTVVLILVSSSLKKFLHQIKKFESGLPYIQTYSRLVKYTVYKMNQNIQGRASRCLTVTQTKIDIFCLQCKQQIINDCRSYMHLFRQWGQRMLTSKLIGIGLGLHRSKDPLWEPMIMWIFDLQRYMLLHDKMHIINLNPKLSAIIGEHVLPLCLWKAPYRAPPWWLFKAPGVIVIHWQWLDDNHKEVLLLMDDIDSDTSWPICSTGVLS